MIRIAFFDIDGTLAPFDGSGITPASIRALDALKAAGIKVFIASGRHRCVMNNLKDYPFDGYVCTNGAYILADGEVIFSHPIDAADAMAVSNALQGTGIPCVVYNADGIWASCYNDTAREVFGMLGIATPPRSDLLELAREPIYQFTPFLTADREDIIRSRASNVVISRWHPAFVDLNPAGITKAEGLAQVLSHYGFSREECIAFGDGGNDVEMLEFAGIGVAMGGALPEVKSRADFVTETVEDDGVSSALHHFGLI